MPASALRQACDRCSARAQVRAELPAGELHFCGHHARAYGERLLAAGARLVTLPGAPAAIAGKPRSRHLAA
jgi:hypothetical protein